MFPSMLPLSIEIIGHLNDRLCGLILLTVVMYERLSCGFFWRISMLFDHSMRSAEALHHGQGGNMISTIVCFGHVYKSNMFLCGAAPNTKKQLLGVLEYREGKLLVRYLGVPLNTQSFLPMIAQFLWTKSRLKLGVG
jgi:hypothetical protein